MFFSQKFLPMNVHRERMQLVRSLCLLIRKTKALVFVCIFQKNNTIGEKGRRVREAGRERRRKKGRQKFFRE